MRRVLLAGEISFRDIVAVVERHKLAHFTVSAAKENAPIARTGSHRHSEDDLNGLVAGHSSRADGGSPVDDEPVAVLPAGAVRERQVVDAAGAGEVLPDRRVRVVRPRAGVVDGVPLGHQVFTLRVARAGVGGGIERKRQRRRRKSHQQDFTVHVHISPYWDECTLIPENPG